MPRPRFAAAAARAGHPDRPTRDRVFAAAAAEFAAHGFAGASIDRIAAAARLNKAMIYYHFASKADLYAEILRDMFGAVEARVRQAAASTASPEDKVRRFAVAIAAEAELRPHFPPIWFREIAEGGAHLDPRTLQHLAGVVGTLRRIIDEGVRAGRFRRVHPFLVHAGIVGPLLLFFASQRLRGRLEKAGVPTGALTRDQVLQHVQELALATLEGRKS
jgi:TetR/AcrR family transcriptional regulator